MTVTPNALIDVTAKSAAVYTKFQFERTGFFSVDPDSSNGKVYSFRLITFVPVFARNYENFFTLTKLPKSKVARVEIGKNKPYSISTILPIFLPLIFVRVRRGPNKLLWGKMGPCKKNQVSVISKHNFIH